MEILLKIDKIWSSFEAFILSFMTILMSALLIGNASSRYLFGVSWAFTEEVGQISIIVMTFMGLGYAARKRMHIEMSGLYDILPKKYRWLLSILITSGTSIVLLILTYLSIKYVNHLFEIKQTTNVLRIPLYLVLSVVPIGFFLAFVRYLVDFINITFNKAEY